MNYSPDEQLQLLEQQCKNIAPVLYRDSALYLQYIRKYLKSSVRELVFTIYLSSVNAPSNSDDDIKASLQKNIDQLVDRTISLLTVEHLMDLSIQIEKETQLKREMAKAQLIKALDSEKIPPPPIDGSVELSLSPPLDNPELMNIWMNSETNDELITNHEDLSQISDSSYEDNLENDNDIQRSSADNQGSEKDKNITDRKLLDSDVFKSIFIMAGQAISKSKGRIRKSRDILDDNNINKTVKEKNDSLLPEDPKALLEWINSFESGLSRRLINLSHAINIELLRSGVILTLLPINLLEAVSRGQIETLHSVPNLLKMKVPVQSSFIDEGIDISCVLLRPSEFEFQNPIIRRCRSTLTKNRSLLNKMVRQQNHWRGRSIAKDAHKSWWKN